MIELIDVLPSYLVKYSSIKKDSHSIDVELNALASYINSSYFVFIFVSSIIFLDLPSPKSPPKPKQMEFASQAASKTQQYFSFLPFFN